MLSNYIFGGDSLYGMGITPKIGFSLIGTQLFATLCAFFLLWIIYKLALKKKTE
jgi:hypothetical protein